MKGVTLSVSLQDPVGKEQKRLVVVLEVEASRMSGREAAEVLGLSFPSRIPWGETGQEIDRRVSKGGRGPGLLRARTGRTGTRQPGTTIREENTRGDTEGDSRVSAKLLPGLQ